MVELHDSDEDELEFGGVALDPSSSQSDRIVPSKSAVARPGKGGARGGREIETVIVDESEEGEFEEEQGVDGSDQDQEESSNELQRARLTKYDDEIASISRRIDELRTLRQSITDERNQFCSASLKRRPHPSISTSIKRQKVATSDYSVAFPWSTNLKALMRRVWGIESFRRNQEAVINATMSRRDVVCLMPTGGGKSLCFQAPALLEKGTTLVVTPLLSLMQDQIYNLRAVGVRAETIHGATSAADAKAILKRLVEGGVKQGKRKRSQEDVEIDEDEREVKLIYVTPEKIAKSKTFAAGLQKMYDAGLLSRIVIDEAHCCSSLGHDFRLSYKDLGILRNLFPKTPILALTATCPPKVLEEVIKILRLKPAMEVGDARSDSTLLYTSPLYRPNLRYSVVPKNTSALLQITDMVEFISEHHLGELGIIYCHSQNDTVSIAAGINEQSKGKIVAAAYHAGMHDQEKELVHSRWRARKIQFVVATIAFGMGIDAPDVRVVIHQCMSKSIEGYYQESGRAGRDGVPADCRIYFRSADVSRLSGMVSSEQGGSRKLLEMAKFAGDLVTCRKIAFARYLSSDGFNGGEEVCGHCDNCTRHPSSFKEVDITDSAYRALRILDAAVKEQRGTVTLAQGVDLVRGLGGGNFTTQNGKNKGKGKVDVLAVAGGKVVLSKEDTEAMLLHLLIEGYLGETFSYTAYSTNSYLSTTTNSQRLSRLEPRKVATPGFRFPFEVLVAFRTITRAKRKSSVAGAKPTAGKKAAKRATTVEAELAPEGSQEDAEEGDMDGEEEMRVQQGDGWQVWPKSGRFE